MSDKYFVDTDILMYAHDTSAGAKHERAKAVVEDLWRDRTGVVSTQLLPRVRVTTGARSIGGIVLLFRKGQAHRARSGPGSRSRPSHNLELCRPGCGQRITYAIDV